VSRLARRPRSQGHLVKRRQVREAVAALLEAEMDRCRCSGRVRRYAAARDTTVAMAASMGRYPVTLMSAAPVAMDIVCGTVTRVAAAE
jgi:hypothetical protein